MSLKILHLRFFELKLRADSPPARPYAMTQSAVNIRIAAARVWKRQAGLAARITLTSSQRW